MRSRDKNARTSRRRQRKAERKQMFKEYLDWLVHDMGWVFLLLGCVIGKILSNAVRAMGW